MVKMVVVLVIGLIRSRPISLSYSIRQMSEVKLEAPGLNEEGKVEEHNEYEPPWTTLLSDPPKRKFIASTEPNDMKQTADPARWQQQKDGQFTFKLEPPLKPPSPWSAHTNLKAKGHETPKVERASPTLSSVGPPTLSSLDTRQHPPN